MKYTMRPADNLNNRCEIVEKRLDILDKVRIMGTIESTLFNSLAAQ